MFKPIAIGVGVLFVVFIGTVLIVAAAKPDVFRVQRSARIGAPPDRIFALINNLRLWESWSPYEKLDPQMKRSYSGPESGEGAVYEWDGNGNVGAGRTTIVESTPHSRIAISLEMFRPFRCNNDVLFTLTSSGEATEVTWSMAGPSTYVSKIVSVFINMDRMVGSQFEEGLANLKGVAEKSDVTSRDLEPVGKAGTRRL